jgi:hypothetical protein
MVLEVELRTAATIVVCRERLRAVALAQRAPDEPDEADGRNLE